MIKTGLLFGSFNPVHIGHIALAGYMKEFIPLDEIWFIVSPQNPHKNPEHLASPVTRLNMVRLAIKEFPGFHASDIEFNLPVPSYTLKTMEKIKEGFPERDFYIITGADNIDSINSWRGGKKLVKEHKFLIYPRLNASIKNLDIFSNAVLADAPVINISSSFIRISLREGKDMRAFVPQNTYEYIVKNKIYTW